MTLSEELNWRGLIQQTTITNQKQLDTQKWTVYIGFDASKSSQTIGNLAAMMTVWVFLRHGHRVILLAGGATSLIGDPSGKDQERLLASKDEIAANIKNAFAQLKQIFQNQPVIYVNNLNWFENFAVIDFLRDVGKHFSITPLIQREYIAARLGEGGTGMTYTEFSYTLLQGYDFLQLFDQHQCNLQIGGSDQWGNCLSGVELIRRVRQQTVHAITLPLIINKATGKKFGKSEEQTVWLDKQLTHPSDFYQFWLNTSDEDVLNYLKIFTALNKEQIEQIRQEGQKDAKQRLGQKTLAQEVTKLVHGHKYVQLAQTFSTLAFEKTQPAINKTIKEVQQIKTILDDEQSTLKLKTWPNSFNDLTPFFDDLIQKIDFLTSRTQVKQLLKNKALKLITLKKTTLKTYSLVSHILTEDLLLNNQLKTLQQEPLLIIVGKNTMRSFQ